MDTLKYRIVLKIAELKSVTKAAEELGYTQPGITRLVNSLENEMGVKLFARTRNGSVLTSSGERLLPYFEKMVNLESEMNTALNDIKEVACSNITVGAFTSISIKYLPNIIKRFNEKYPNITVHVKHGVRFEKEILDGDVDCAFVIKPAAYKLEEHLFEYEQMMAILPKNHPLANKTIIDPEELVNETFIIPDNSTRNDFDFLCSLMGKTPQIITANDDLASVCFTINGYGITFCSRSLFETVQNDNIVGIPVKNFFRTILLCTKPESYISESVKSFVDFCCLEENRH